MYKSGCHKVATADKAPRQPSQKGKLCILGTGNDIAGPMFSKHVHGPNIRNFSDLNSLMDFDRPLFFLFFVKPDHYFFSKLFFLSVICILSIQIKKARIFSGSKLPLPLL